MRRARPGGFTLVEVMVALVVLAIMSLAASGMLFSSAAVSNNDTEFKTAMADLQAVMEAINGTPFDNIVTTYPNGQAVAAFDGLHLNDESLTVSYPNPAATNPLQVDFKVTWKGQGGSGGLVKSKSMTGLRVR